MANARSVLHSRFCWIAANMRVAPLRRIDEAERGGLGTAIQVIVDCFIDILFGARPQGNGLGLHAWPLWTRARKVSK